MSKPMGWLRAPGSLATSMVAQLRAGAFRIGGVRFFRAAQVSLGPHTRVQRGTLLDARGGMIEIGPDVWIGSGATILTDDPNASRDLPESPAAPVILEARAWIGSRAIILPGVRIGAGAVVAAETVVTHDVAAGAIVAGTPARWVGWRHADGSLEFTVPAALVDADSRSKTGQCPSR